MNTIKMSKVLALIIVVAMVMAVVPVAFAADDEIGSTNFYGWDFKNGVIRETVGVETAEAAVVSWGDDRVSFVEFTLPEGTTVAEGQMLSADISIMAWGNEGAANSTVATIFAIDPAAVEAKDNEQLTAARETARNVKVGTIAFDFAAKDVWNDAPSVGKVVVPAASIQEGKVAFLLSNRAQDGVERNGIASLKDAKLSNIKVVAPASVTVDIVDANGEILADDIATVDGFISGDTYDGSGLTFNKYLVADKNLYMVDRPEEAITLDAGENEYNLVATLYKTIVGENIITNPSFENDMEDWTTVDGANLAEAVKADDESDQFEIVGDIAADDTAEPPVAAQKRTTDGEKALWLKGGAVGGSNAGTQVDTSWAVEPNTRYFASFDFMSTRKDNGTQYMWLYATDSAETPTISYYAEALDNNSQQYQQMNVHTRNIFETKQFIIETGETQNKIGFGGAWFINDAAPIVDNFQLYELADLSDDVTYDVVVTTDGTANGTELDRIENQEGTIGDEVEIVAGKFVNDKRVGKEYYRSQATTIKLEQGKTTYYVGADVIATINGAEAVEAVTVEGYDAILPSTVKTTVDTEEESFEAETLPVTWDGTTGTIADTDVTVNAVVTELPPAFSPTANMTVGSVNVQNQQVDAWNDAYKLPAALSDFTTALMVTYNHDGDDHILFNNAVDTPANNEAFNRSHVHIKISKDGIQVRDGKQGDKGTNALQTVLPVTEGNNYEIIVDYTTESYDVYVRDMMTGAVGIYKGAVSRTAGPVDGIAFVGNGSSTAKDAFTVTKCDVAAEVVDVPAEAEVKANLDYITDGEDADTLVINFTTDAEGATLKIYSDDIDNTLVGQAEVVADKSVAVVPKNANITYTARLVDTDTGFMIGGASAALYPMVAADIAANIDEYTSADELKLVDKAVAVLSEGGAVDPKVDFIKVETTGEGEEAATVITLDEALFAKGFGFKGAIKAGTAGAVVTTEPVDDNTLYSKITIKGNEVTLENADSAVTFSLDAVQIEFVATEVDEADAGADADFGLVDEL